MKPPSIGILSDATGKTIFSTIPNIGGITYVTWQITRAKEPVFDENDNLVSYNVADKRRISGSIAFKKRDINVDTFDLIITHNGKENGNMTTTTISGVELTSDGSTCGFVAKDITHEIESEDEPVTCKRCEDITDETIDRLKKEKRIAELKAELLELEGPPGHLGGYIINTNPIASSNIDPPITTFTPTNSSNCVGYPPRSVSRNLIPTDKNGKEMCGEWAGAYPYCCSRHAELYFDTAG